MTDDTRTPTAIGPSHKEALMCVGGPYDGRLVEISKMQNVLAVAVVAKPTFTEPVNLETLDCSHFFYQRTKYQAGGEVRMFLAPQADTPGETLNRLIDGYRQPDLQRSRTGR